MATIYAIKGLLLEEVLLNLLKESGYSIVNDVNNDATLKQGHSGIEVKGRVGITKLMQLLILL